jgi:hypothetical protein
MCTASWLTAEDGFHFFFNRDERRIRSRGLPPQRRLTAGVAYLSPIDPDSGGTWFAATDRGLILALLNRRVGGPGSAGRRSRGSLIPELVAAGNLAEVAERLARMPLEDCAPFRLFANLQGEGDGLGAVWTGTELSIQSITTRSGLLCSSSRGDREVTEQRSALWAGRAAERAADGCEELRRFHRSHLPQRSATSVCMHRQDAATVSHLEVAREPHLVRVAYFDGSPCTAGEPETSVLELVGPPARTGQG